MQTIISIIEVILLTIPMLLAVAFTTLAERKTMASMQRRIGPNIVGTYGSLQAFADALKLLLKEYIAPAQAAIALFFLGPIITLNFALLGYAVVPFGPGLIIGDLDLGILFVYTVSSLSTYGILLAGWSANSKYAFLGSLRSTAQLISYELILSSAVLLVVLLTSSLNLTANVESQKITYFLFPLLPAFIIFFIGAIAETNRAPFDLAEAESELVSGFMTEHSSVIFVFFFLAEYASILLICIFTIILFVGGYLTLIYFDIQFQQALSYGLTLGSKACYLIFVFIWVRASFPRIRFDQLMSSCWTILLPIIIALIIFVPCIMYCLHLYNLDINFNRWESMAKDPVLDNNYNGQDQIVLRGMEKTNRFMLNNKEQTLTIYNINENLRTGNKSTWGLSFTKDLCNLPKHPVKMSFCEGDRDINLNFNGNRFTLIGYR